MHSATIAASVMPRRWAGDRAARTVYVLALVTGFALLTALFAQISIPLWFTPVPITGQTFAVLLSGAALGSRAGAGSQALYWVMGAAGLPFYADGEGGWSAATGATAGYLLGFIVAGYAVGYLAEQRQDRRFSTSVGAFLTGTFIIYVLGVAGLMLHDLRTPRVSWSFTDVVTTIGVGPFLIGDAIKLLLAAGLLPTLWKLIGPRSP